MSSHEIARDRLVAVVAPGHPPAGEQAVHLKRPAGEVFVDLPATPPGSAATSPSR